MRVASLVVDPLTTLPIVVLEDDAGVAVVPIRIGAGDASAIAAELDRIDFVRPTTHQLLGDLLAGAGVRVDSVEIDAIDDGSFFGVIHLELPSGERVRQEARSSDALALALRSGAEIRVAQAVVERAALGEVPAAGVSAGVLCDGGAPLELAAPGDDGADPTDAAGELLSKCQVKWKM